MALRLTIARSKFTEQQIAFALQQAEGGTQVAEVCRKMGISQATFFRCKQLYGGLMPSEVKKLRQLEEENTRLRKVIADLTLDKEMLQKVIHRKL
jgi:putative transposase